MTALTSKTPGDTTKNQDRDDNIDSQNSNIIAGDTNLNTTQVHIPRIEQDILNQEQGDIQRIELLGQNQVLNNKQGNKNEHHDELSDTNNTNNRNDDKTRNDAVIQPPNELGYTLRINIRDTAVITNTVNDVEMFQPSDQISKLCCHVTIKEE